MPSTVIFAINNEGRVSTFEARYTRQLSRKYFVWVSNDFPYKESALYVFDVRKLFIQSMTFPF